MISNIQLLRALAAMAVVYFHGSYIFGGVHTDLKAVAIFFVVSGFIMTHISRSRADGFMVNRITRVVPLYWVCTIAFFMLINLELMNPIYKIPQIWGWLLHDRTTLQWYLEHKTGFTDGQLVGQLVRSLTFIPFRNDQGFMFPVLGVGWTLNLEMYFYVIFAVCLMINTRWAPILTAIVILFVKLSVWITIDPGELLMFYGDRYTGFFVLGIATYYIWHVRPASFENWVVTHRWTIGIVIAIALSTFNYFPLREIKALIGYAPAMFLYFMLPFATVLFALFLNNKGLCASSRTILLLGEASFSIYLTHPFVAVIVETTLKRYPEMSGLMRPVAFAFFMAICAVIGIFVHRKIEMPLLSYARLASRFRSTTNTRNPV
ncbi:acyltransferase family protein [Paraburkholderia tagetis]|uniref:Acyltransferase n=1 Tax=Paraburkholderia tagetis TaxID=2913261 RepID=A0A9X1UD64_9BURK|nr:acyltransferase [Paraburkholderia tagetis]MCG5072294.1 acyltransferase [Paraburkholderia tagetis]